MHSFPSKSLQHTARFSVSKHQTLISSIHNSAVRVICSMASRQTMAEASTGEFKRTASTFRNTISRDKAAEFPSESGRYHLYISFACPWASRCYAVLKLKGLDDAIGITSVKPKWERTKEGDDHLGWVFPVSENEDAWAKPDTLNGAKTIRELYELASSNNPGKFSVPILWDKKKRTIVNNESSEIVRIFNKEFNNFAKHPEIDLYPSELQAKIDEVNDWVYTTINNGVYKCGFATKQEPYEKAFKDLFDSLDKAENILNEQRYICGDILTEADIRLFVTLIRFDEVYVVHFKCNKRLIREYPNLFNYTKDIYQIPGISSTVSMDHIKQHYYQSHAFINPHGIIPVGSAVDYSAPHNRTRFTT